MEPQGHNLKSLASKVKSSDLASQPASPSKCPVLGSRTALFFELLKMGQGHDQFCFVLGNARELAKKILKAFLPREAWIFGPKTFFFFFGDHFRVVSLVLSLGLECSYPWPREGVLGRTVLDLGFFCVLGLGLDSCVLDPSSDLKGHLGRLCVKNFTVTPLWNNFGNFFRIFSHQLWFFSAKKS